MFATFSLLIAPKNTYVNEFTYPKGANHIQDVFATKLAIVFALTLPIFTLAQIPAFKSGLRADDWQL
jgi:hypothetical protein